MRFIFFIYCIWYPLNTLAIQYWNSNSILCSKILGSLSILSIGFICLAPLGVILNPSLIKTSQTDSKYMNFCLIAGILRISFWAISIIGLRDHLTLLTLNAFGMIIYALLESKFKRISNEYFKY